MDVAVLFYTLVTIPIALSFLLFVPKKVLVRYDKRARPKFKKLAAGIIPLMCLDIGSLIVFLYFIGGGISFGLNVGVELVPFVIISGPILEELIFRLGIIGVMGGGIGWLAKRSGARWHEGKIFKFLLIAVSAITFGLAHMFDIIKRTPQMIALITIGGAIYGYAYTRYGLGSSILMHAIYNVFAFML
jgi:membrane protease YdiL (CAAX protease family)